MINVVKEIQINTTKERLWSLLSDYRLPQLADPAIKNVELLEGGETISLGTIRKIELKAGNLHYIEKVMEIKNGELVTFEKTGGNLPVKKFRSIYKITEGSGFVTLNIHVEYWTKYDFFSGMVGRLFRPMWENSIDKFLKGISKLV